jgi:hypothetical protein
MVKYRISKWLGIAPQKVRNRTSKMVRYRTFVNREPSVAVVKDDLHIRGYDTRPGAFVKQSLHTRSSFKFLFLFLIPT